ncbi:MAG: ankyrin repeat domain-containing protein [Micavibrio sp.]|nr:ankyrin repeat domain-containing protein [Micavibrio sp.]
MAGRKPSGSRFKRAFIIAAAALGLGGGTLTLDNLPKNPDTGTTAITTVGYGTEAAGINISPSDQFWKHTLSLKSDAQRADEMQQAAAAGDSWRIQALFDHGVSPQSQTAIDAMTTAAFTGHTDAFMTMMKNGVEPTANDNDALMWAVRGGNVDIALRLMNYGADVNARDGQALVIAALNNDQSMTDILLGRGADATLQNSAALRMATDLGNTGIADALTARGASLTPPPAVDNSSYLTNGGLNINGDDMFGSPRMGPFSPWQFRTPGPF